MARFLVLSSVFFLVALANASPVRDERDMMGTGLGWLGNIFYTRDMEVQTCKNHGFCNTAVCLAGPVGGTGLFGKIGEAVAAGVAVAAKDVLAEETHKSSCITAGMYDENLAARPVTPILYG